MLDFVGRILKEASTYELRTWAGIVNVVGFVVLWSKVSSSTLVDKAAMLFNRSLEGSRKYRAAKRGVKYEPVLLEKTPAMEISPARLLVTLAGYMIVCVAAIAVADLVMGIEI